jgi:hypothetical protein
MEETNNPIPMKKVTYKMDSPIKPEMLVQSPPEMGTPITVVTSNAMRIGISKGIISPIQTPANFEIR